MSAPKILGTEVRVGDHWELDNLQIVEITKVDGCIEGYVDSLWYQWSLDGSFDPPGWDEFDIHGLISREEARE